MEVVLPITVINEIFGFLKYDLQVIGRVIQINHYYNDLCRRNLIWKSLYVSRYGRQAFQIEKDSHVNIKAVQKFRKEHLKYPPLDEEAKSWYDTVQSIVDYHRQVKPILLDFGSNAVKLMTGKGRMRVMPMPLLRFRYWTNIGHEILMKEIYSIAERENASTAPLSIAINPLFYTNNLENLKDLKKKMSAQRRVVHFKNAGLCVLQSMGLVSGVVVIVGMEHTMVCAFKRGVQIGLNSIPLIGKELMQRIVKPGVTLEDIWDDINLNPFQWHKSQILIENYELRLLHDPELNKNGDYAVNMFFTPNELTEAEKKLVKTRIGLVEHVHDFIKSIKKSNKSISSLFDNVILTGGITSIKGFQERFSKDLKLLSADSNVLYSQSPVFDILKGLYIDSITTESLHDIYQLM